MSLRRACEQVCADHRQRLAAGPGEAARALPALLEGRRYLLVSGRGWLDSQAWARGLIDGAVERVRADPNPTLAHLAEALATTRSTAPELVVAVGGGSALDLAKVLAVGLSSSWDGRTATLPPDARRCLLVAVPTTAGTGSEVTPYASFEHEGRKFSFADARLVPDVVVLDSLLVSQPRALAADAAADALCHSVESLWSRKASDRSRHLAALALEALVAHAPAAVRRGEPMAREAVQQAALLAGAAISLSQTTAVHAVSYPLTARFGVPHGRALAILLPRFLRLNGPHLDEASTRLLCQCCGVADWAGLNDRLAALLEELGLPTLLSGVGVNSADLEVVIAEGYRPDRMGNNPVIPSPDELRALLAD